jgi:hypothetical protein
MKNSLLSCEYVPDTQQHGGVLHARKLCGAKVCCVRKAAGAFWQSASVRYCLGNRPIQVL